MARLLREAGRIKHILSANNDVLASVEGLFEEIDFRMTVTRVEFEKMVEHLLKRIDSPIQQVLTASGMSMSEV